MSIQDYFIDLTGIDWAVVLADWRHLLPDQFTVWLMNRFGDLFVAYSDESIHMLDVGAGTVERIADNREHFKARIDEGDNANQWLMIPLVDKAVAAGMHLSPGRCYGYKLPPVLGGDYTVENTGVLSIEEHFGFNADLHRQIKDLPDGTPIVPKPINVPGK